MKLRKFGVALAAVAALTLTACGSDAATTSSSGAGNSGAAGSSDAGAASGSSMAPAESSAASSDAAAESSAASGEVSSAASGAASAPADPGNSKVLQDAAGGKLTVGIKYDQPGLGTKNPDGSFSGFDVDVARYVAKELGVDEANVNLVEVKSAEREDKISKGEIDYMVGTYSITDEREKVVSFAGPYFVAHQDLLVKADNTDITGPDAMNGKILCSVTGSTSAQKVKDDHSESVALQEFGTYSECVAQLKAGVVDSVTTDDVILAGFAALDPGQFKIVGKGFSDENYGVGLALGDEAGKAAINAALKKMIEDGSWKASLEANVGPSGYTIPSPPTIP